jgi:hypothetical protein
MRFYLLILAIATGAGGYWYGGYVTDIKWKADTEEAINEAVTAALSKERSLQHEVNKIAQRQADELHSVNERLTSELDSLRNRQSRRDVSRDTGIQCDGARGDELSREDAAAFTRLAADAEVHRIAYIACRDYAAKIKAMTRN